MSTDNHRSFPAITLAAIGVVYGDIRTARYIHFVNFYPASLVLALNAMPCLAFYWLIFWLLIFVVSIKYLTFVMQADSTVRGGS
ncbi:KUP/HAK/KT family potassium transporter [Escherichia coli]